jgi:hypothetical protein
MAEEEPSEYLIYVVGVDTPVRAHMTQEERDTLATVLAMPTTGSRTFDVTGKGGTVWVLRVDHIAALRLASRQGVDNARRPARKG